MAIIDIFDRFSKFTILYVFIIAYLIFILTYFLYRYDGFSTFNNVTLATWLLGIVMTVSFLFMFNKNSEQNPSLLLISVIGYPNSGKTVYISVLFREFLTNKFKNIIFAPYGEETTEKITRNINSLMMQRWLDKTNINDIFPFRALAYKGKGISQKRFQIEIRDFAGEHFEKSSNEKWLHKNKYFKNIAESDIFFFVIDGEEVLEAIKLSNFKELTKTENSIIAALELIKQYKSVLLEKKLNAPVALIFLKWDLIINYINSDTELSIEQMKICEKLIEYCHFNCLNFDIFEVSSVGHITEDGRPPKDLEPYHVTDPIIWAINKM